VISPLAYSFLLPPTRTRRLRVFAAALAGMVPLRLLVALALSGASVQAAHGVSVGDLGHEVSRSRQGACQTRTDSGSPVQPPIEQPPVGPVR